MSYVTIAKLVDESEVEYGMVCDPDDHSVYTEDLRKNSGRPFIGMGYIYSIGGVVQTGWKNKLFEVWGYNEYDKKRYGGVGSQVKADAPNFNSLSFRLEPRMPHLLQKRD